MTTVRESSLPKLRALRDRLELVEEDVRKFFNLSLDLFSIADRKRIVRVNRAWERLLGWTVNELEGRELLDLVHPDDQDRTSEMFMKMESEPIYEFQQRIRKKDGRYVSVCWRATEWSEKGLTYAVGRVSQ